MLIRAAALVWVAKSTKLSFIKWHLMWKLSKRHCSICYPKKDPFASEAKVWVKNTDCIRSLSSKTGHVYTFQSWCFFITSLYKFSQEPVPKKISFCCFNFPLWNNMGHENTLLSCWNHSFLLPRKLRVKLLPYTFNYKVESRILKGKAGNIRLTRNEP